MENSALDPSGHDWNVVLAAGQGTRLAPLTGLLYGRALPKQYAALEDDRTLLQKTLDRIAPLAPRSRTVVVIAAEHEDLARQQLAEFPGLDLAVQPRNAGTGPGMLFPLARVLARDPDARVLVFPADHHVGRPGALVAAAQRARDAAGSAESGIALIGVPADAPDIHLGWLVPGRPLGRSGSDLRAVTRFVEKPPMALAKQLFRKGALWNTLIFGGRAAALWRIAAHHLPEQAELLAHYLPHVDRASDSWAVAALYQGMGSADFSRDILQRSVGLGVVTMTHAGWSDWGTPERVLQTLAGTESGDRLLARILAASTRRPPHRATPEHAAWAAA